MVEMTDIKRDQQMYVGQKALIVKGDSVLVMIDNRKNFDLPGGKIQKTDTNAIQSLFREVEEEIGLDITIQDVFETMYLPKGYLMDYPLQPMFIVVYRAMYKSGEVQLSDEHGKYEWVTKDTYQKYKKHDADRMVFYPVVEKYFSE